MAGVIGQRDLSMLRKLLIFKAFILSLAWCFTVQASNKTCRTESACFKPDVTWSVSDGEITDVCHNYAYGDWRYRRCRTEAGKVFKQRCREYKEKARNSQGDIRERARRQQDLFCISYRP